MDVTDAVRSCRDLARRREILKDSRVGSFAVIGVVLLALCQTALFAFGKDGGEPLDACASSGSQPVRFGARRTALRPMSTSQYAAQKKAEVAHHRSLRPARGVSRGGLSCRWRTGRRSAAVLPGTRSRSGKRSASLDGMNGDISGYALTLLRALRRGGMGAHLKEKGKHHGFYFRRGLSGQDRFCQRSLLSRRGTSFPAPARDRFLRRCVDNIESFTLACTRAGIDPSSISACTAASGKRAFSSAGTCSAALCPWERKRARGGRIPDGLRNI